MSEYTRLDPRTNSHAEFPEQSEPNQEFRIHIAVNRNFVGKLPSGDPRWVRFNDSFDNMTLTPRELMAEIGAGHAFTSPHRHVHHELPNGRRSAYRHHLNWISSQHLALDHDDAGFADLRQNSFVAQYASFLYSTPSHTEEAPRSRTVFILEYPLDSKAKYGCAAAALHWKFVGLADRACKDVARAFFGSPGCKFEYVGNVLPLAVLEGFIDEFDAAMDAERTRRESRLPEFFNNEPELSEIQAALHCIPQKLEYNDWLRIGMAIHSAFPHQRGLQVWEEWSPGYPGECERKWASFCPVGNDSGQITVGTLFALAKDYGFQMPRHRQRGEASAHETSLTCVSEEQDPSVPTNRISIDEKPSICDGTDEFNPLVKPIRAVCLGQIGDYVELMAELTGSPREFHQLSGLVAYASVLHNAMIPIPWAGSRGLRPNIYGGIIANSTVFGKTASLRKIDEVHAYDEMPNCVRLPLQFTEEGLMSSLSVTPSGIIVRDEIGQLFGSHRKRYLETVIPFLTQIYDGDDYVKHLASGRIEVKGPYLNIIGATTPSRFYDSVRESDWEDGFMVRWLFALPECEPNFDYCPPLSTEAHNKRLSILRAHLIAIHNQPNTAFTFAQPEAYKDVFHTRYRDYMREAYESNASDRVSAIVKRYCTYGLKLALILSVARGHKWGTIPTDCLEDGIQLADNYKRQVHTLLSNQSATRVDGGKLQMVFRVIRDWQTRYGKESDSLYPTRREVGQYAHLKRQLRDQCIDRLLEMGAISEVPAGRSTVLVPNSDRLPIGRIRTT